MNMTDTELMNLKAAREEKRLFSSTLASNERSLRAIGGNGYGICMRCHGPIPVKRLQSIPWARYCGRCQQRIEADEEYTTTPDFDEPQAA